VTRQHKPVILQGTDYPELIAAADTLRAALETERADGAIADMPEGLFAALIALADEIEPWITEP
jgi:hypothetical protein